MQAQTSLLPLTASTPPTAPVEQDWGLAGDALTVGAAGVGAALSIVGLVAVANGDTTVGVASLAIPLVVPAGFAAGARALQPRRTLLNVALPAAGATLGTAVGAVGYLALLNTTGSIVQTASAHNASAAVAVALSTVALGTMLTTTGAVALAHLIEGE